MKLAQGAIVLGDRPLTLQNVDFNRGLILRRGRECLRLTRRNRGVALDEGRHHSTQGFNSQGKRGHIKQEHISHLAGKYATLNGSAAAL